MFSYKVVYHLAYNPCTWIVYGKSVLFGKIKIWYGFFINCCFCARWEMCWYSFNSHFIKNLSWFKFPALHFNCWKTIFDFIEYYAAEIINQRWPQLIVISYNQSSTNIPYQVWSPLPHIFSILSRKIRDHLANITRKAKWTNLICKKIKNI